MKSRIAIAVLAVIVAVTSLCLGGCENNSETSDNSSSSSILSSETESSESSSENDSSVSENSGSSSSSEASTLEVPKGEPTIFVGLDGETIYSGEISEIEGTDKSAEEITKTDYWTSVLCEGFQYFVEPIDIAYNNYENPEMFDDIVYKGEISENKNKCKRVNVGDEICGLKLVSGVSEFRIDDYADTPEPYFYDGYLFGSDSERYVAEFEGNIKIAGFLGVTAPNDYEPDGGSLHFTPTESKLPILGDKPEFFERTNFVGSDYSVYSDMTDIDCGFIQELQCDTKGLDVGDMAFVCLTLSDIKYKSSQSITAEIENIEMLSDILYQE